MAGWLEIERLMTLVDDRTDYNSVTVEPGSLFAIDARIEDYDPPADQVSFLIGVATDHLETFGRLLRADGGLPPLAGYTLLRAAIEAAATAIWLRMPGTSNARIGRSLWMIVNAREDVEGLAARLGLTNQAGYDRMRTRVDGIIESRRGLNPGVLTRHHTKTSIIAEAQRRVRRRLFSCLEAWQACSGITHSNRTTALMFLEHQHLGVSSNNRTTYWMTASAYVTSEVMNLAVGCMTTAIDLYIEHSRA